MDLLLLAGMTWLLLALLVLPPLACAAQAWHREDVRLGYERDWRDVTSSPR